MTALLTQLETHAGVLRGVDLQALGYTRVALAEAVRRGEIRRLRPGVFAAPSAAAEVIAAAAHGGALTCARALLRHGVWVLTDDARPHVWIGRSGRQHPHAGCACIVHCGGRPNGLGLVEIERALEHLFRCQGEEAFFAALESARYQRMIGPAALARIRSALPKPARWLVDFSREDAESGLESLLRLRLHRLGIAVRTQVRIPEVGRVDALIGDYLIIEVDGRENHDGPSKRHKDLRRDAAAARLGYRTLRFDYALVLHDWPSVEAAIRVALATR